MILDWSAYEPYRPLYPIAHEDMNRSEARAEFAHWMTSRQERWTELRSLMSQWDLTLSADDQGIRSMDEFFRGILEPNPDDPSRPADRCFAVVNDMSVVIGDMAIERHPWLSWQLMTGNKHDDALHRPVLKGFSTASSPKYNVDVIGSLGVYAFAKILRAEKCPPLGEGLLQFIAENA